MMQSKKPGIRKGTGKRATKARRGSIDACIRVHMQQMRRQVRRMGADGRSEGDLPGLQVGEGGEALFRLFDRQRHLQAVERRRLTALLTRRRSADRNEKNPGRDVPGSFYLVAPRGVEPLIHG